jgi:hypothetical protein
VSLFAFVLIVCNEPHRDIPNYDDDINDTDDFNVTCATIIPTPLHCSKNKTNSDKTEIV